MFVYTGSCTTVKCDNGKFCVQDQHGLPHCVHCQTDCPPVYDMTDAICGSDSITYNSLCEFQRAACMSGSKPVGLAYLGPCSGKWPHILLLFDDQSKLAGLVHNLKSLALTI